jgi:hypothetical protein
VPIVKFAAAPVKTMAPIFSPALLITMFVVVLAELKVAISLFAAPMAPGKKPAPVLQLFSTPVVTQLPLVGAAFQVALAAELRPADPSSSDATSVAMEVARATGRFRHTRERAGETTAVGDKGLMVWDF